MAKLTSVQQKVLDQLMDSVYLAIHKPRTPGLIKPSATLLRFDSIYPNGKYAGDINLKTANALVAKGAVKQVETLTYKTVSGTMTVWEAN